MMIQPTSALAGHKSERGTHGAHTPFLPQNVTEDAGDGHHVISSPSASPEPPLAALKRLHGRPLKVAILSDFTRIPYANGAVFQTRALYHALHTCGHQATLIGPRDPDASVGEVPPGTI